MGSENPTDKLEADGLPSAGVSFYPTSQEQLQVFRDEQSALAHFKATVPPLVHANNPSAKNTTARTIVTIPLQRRCLSFL